MAVFNQKPDIIYSHHLTTCASFWSCAWTCCSRADQPMRWCSRQVGACGPCLAPSSTLCWPCGGSSAGSSSAAPHPPQEEDPPRTPLSVMPRPPHPLGSQRGESRLCSWLLKVQSVILKRLLTFSSTANLKTPLPSVLLKQCVEGLE